MRILDAVLAFFEDRSGWVILVVLALAIGLLIVIKKDDDRRCNELMQLAHTVSDSLVAKVGCEQIRSATTTSIAIGAAAGAVAGSRR